MKPIVLKMSAFGPYKKTEVIDFTELDEHQLFVVSGTTGAGKTTIFDAICFALYGSSSGSDRDQTKMLRSDFAEDETHTAVELLFEMHGRKYRVLRQLGHVKQGRKTATGEKYEFYEVLKDGSEVAVVERQRVSDINPKLEEIIGLTYDQFSQIVMLPQGEFRKLLTSNSENKEAILRKIFKTDRYGKMVKILEDKKRLAEADAKTAKMMRDSYVEQIAGALPNRESDLFSFIQNRANVYQIQQALLEEQKYYEQLTDINYTKYEQSKNDFSAMNEKFISAKSLNDRIEALKQLQLKHAQALENKPKFEEMNVQAEAAQRATMLHYLDEQCKAMSEELKMKQRTNEQLVEQLQQVEQAFIQAEQTFEQEKSNEALRQRVHNEVNQLQALIPVYEQIEQTKQSLSTATKQRDQSKQKLQQLMTSLEQTKQQSGLLREKTTVLEEQISKLPELLEAIHKTQAIVTTSNKLQLALKNEEMLSTSYNAVEKDYTNAQQQYELEEQKWLSSQAQVLANKLSPGCACPVCGSTEHKKVHFDEANSVDETKLKQLKVSASNLQLKKNELQVQLNVASSKVAELQADLNTLCDSNTEILQAKEQLASLMNESERLKLKQQQLVGLKEQQQQLLHQQTDVEATIQVAQQQLSQSEQIYYEISSKYAQQQQSLQPSIANISELHAAIQTANEKLIQLQQKWEQAQQHFYDRQILVEKHKQQLQLVTKHVEELTNKLNDSREKFKAKLQEAKFVNYAAYQAAKRTDTEIEQLKNSYLQFVNELHAIEMKLQEEQIALKDAEQQDLTALQMQVQQLKIAEEQAFEQYKLAQKHEQLCGEFHSKLEQVAEKIFRLEEVTNQLIDIHNLLKGQNAKKISFERFVQTGYLEQITEAANVRLRNLSNGQYSLTCSERQESHGRQSGLSLDVYDSYTGQTRDVKTLSGGEKFNASLSLALGMAEVIQNFQGNVRIDTMFIDEGFGSLDEESLMRAIDTLFELQNTGRMIGVISHVAELKDAFPAILQVEKQKEGFSKTKFVLK